MDTIENIGVTIRPPRCSTIAEAASIPMQALQLVEAGKARPFIERRYALSEVADALRHVGEGHTRGQVVIRIAD